MGWFGADEPSPEEQVKSWRSKLRHEQRSMDRQIRAIEREEFKIKQSVKDAAKKGQIDVCKVLAKSLVESKRARNRIHATKAQINSVAMQMQHQLSMLRMSGALEKSSAVMKSMSDLVRVPELSATMAGLAREMEKAGLIEEMVEDTFDSLDTADDIEEEAAEEVDKILFEITKGQMGAAPEAVDTELVSEQEAAADAEAEDMMQRLQALKS